MNANSSPPVEKKDILHGDDESTRQRIPTNGKGQSSQKPKLRVRKTMPPLHLAASSVYDTTPRFDSFLHI